MKLTIALITLVSTMAFATGTQKAAPAAAVTTPAATTTTTTTTTTPATTKTMTTEASKAVVAPATAQATCKEGQHMDAKTHTCVDKKVTH